MRKNIRVKEAMGSKCSGYVSLFFFTVVVLLFSFPPAQTFDYDPLRRTVRNFKNFFSFRLLLVPHSSRFPVYPLAPQQHTRIIASFLSCWGYLGQDCGPSAMLSDAHGCLSVCLNHSLYCIGRFNFGEMAHQIIPIRRSCRRPGKLFAATANCLLPQLSMSKVRKKVRSTVTSHQHERGFVYFPRAVRNRRYNLQC